MSMPTLRRFTLACFLALIVLGVAWETWLAPLRPGAWILALKVVPLVAALRPIARGDLRTFQWWSMLVLLYLMEGLVRATSDTGPSVPLAVVETILASAAFGAILLFARQSKRPAS